MLYFLGIINNKGSSPTTVPLSTIFGNPFQRCSNANFDQSFYIAASAEFAEK